MGQRVFIQSARCHGKTLQVRRLEADEGRRRVAEPAQDRDQLLRGDPAAAVERLADGRVRPSYRASEINLRQIPSVELGPEFTHYLTLPRDRGEAFTMPQPLRNRKGSMPEIQGIVGVVFPVGEPPRVVIFDTPSQAQDAAAKMHRAGKYERILLAKPYAEFVEVKP
jgi:hypothetical protein